MIGIPTIRSSRLKRAIIELSRAYYLAYRDIQRQPNTLWKLNLVSGLIGYAKNGVLQGF